MNKFLVVFALVANVSAVTLRDAPYTARANDQKLHWEQIAGSETDEKKRDKRAVAGNADLTASNAALPTTNAFAK